MNFGSTRVSQHICNTKRWIKFSPTGKWYVIPIFPFTYSLSFLIHTFIGFQLTDFLTDTLHGVLTLDATLAGHPIVQVANTPNQITELFDAITYSKGASVIRMLANYVGEETFAKAVTNYLNKHKYGNAVTEDLLNQIESLDNTKDVK